MISISQALKTVKENTFELAQETVSLENAAGRILAENVFADTDLPPFDRSQMDGYAVKASETKNAPVKLRIVGEAAAGRGWHNELKSGEAVRIMTGAPIPKGADAVQKLELAREEAGFVEILEAVKKEQNITLQASEIAHEAKVFTKGETINAAMIASLASFGYAQVQASRSPRVAIIATGSELVEMSQTPQQDQIRDSNSITLQVYAGKCGAVAKAFPLVQDNIEILKSSISAAIENFDVLILSGGVSVGKYDFTKAVLRNLGATILFEKVALRPGKPTVFAKLGEKLVFGLPGNPVSAIVTFNLFVRTALLKMQGASEVELKTGFAILSKKLKGAAERDSYLPAKLSADKKGHLLVEPLKWGGSSDFVSFSKSDALVIVPQGETLEAESVVKIYYLPA